MNIPLLYSGITNNFSMFVGSACMDYDLMPDRNGYPSRPIICLVKDIKGKSIYWSLIKPDRKDCHFSGCRGRIRKAMNREAQRRGEKLVKFLEL